MKKEIGSYIRRQRQVSGLTQQELAERARLTKDVISRMERGRGSIGTNAYQAVSTAMDIIIPIVIMPECTEQKQ
jgi:transcriptional regulator with XRE-family HTH domain